MYMLNAGVVTYGKLVFLSATDKAAQHARDWDLSHVLGPFGAQRTRVEAHV